jgi:hypothetical protein
VEQTSHRNVKRRLATGAPSTVSARGMPVEIAAEAVLGAPVAQGSGLRRPLGRCPPEKLLLFAARFRQFARDKSSERHDPLRTIAV